MKTSTLTTKLINDEIMTMSPSCYLQQLINLSGDYYGESSGDVVIGRVVLSLIFTLC